MFSTLLLYFFYFLPIHSYASQCNTLFPDDPPPPPQLINQQGLHPPIVIQGLRDLLVKDLRNLVDTLKTNNVDVDKLSWVNLLEDYVEPIISSPDLFLSIAIIGRTNSGKSTLFDSLEGILTGDPDAAISPYSEIGLEATMTQRQLFLASGRMEAGTLIHRYGAMKPAIDIKESSRQGIPLYMNSSALPKNVVFVDTPGIENLFPDQKISNFHTPGLSILKNSEVVLLIFSRSETGDIYHLQLLKDAIQYWGRRKIILAFNVDPHVDPQKAAEQFTLMGSLFEPGFTMDKVGTENSQIIGTYILPESTEVFQGLKAAQLLPIGNSVEFPELVDALNRSVDAVWQDVFGEVIRKIMLEARQSIADLMKSSLRVKLMRQALELMTITAAKQSIIPFPYNAMRDEIHEYWNYVGSDTSAKLREAGDWMARPELQLSFFKNLQRRGPTPLSLSNVSHGVEGVRTESELRMLSGINYLIRQLADRKLVVENQYYKDPETMHLIKDIETNLAELIQLSGKENLAEDLMRTGNLEIPLGTFGEVDVTLEKAIDRIVRTDVDQHAQGLLSQMSQFQPPLTERARQDLIRRLYEYRASRNFLKNGFEGLLVNAHVLVPTAVLASELYAHYQAGIISFNPFTYLIPANISARLVYFTDHRFLDAILQPQVQAWSLARQKSVFANYVNAYILPEIRAELDKADARLFLGAEQGRHLLDILDRHFQDTEKMRNQSLRLVQNIYRNDTDDVMPGVDQPYIFRFYPLRRSE